LNPSVVIGREDLSADGGERIRIAGIAVHPDDTRINSETGFSTILPQQTIIALYLGWQAYTVTSLSLFSGFNFLMAECSRVRQS
jgi:hypothetical protein